MKLPRCYIEAQWASGLARCFILDKDADIDRMAEVGRELTAASRVVAKTSPKKGPPACGDCGAFFQFVAHELNSKDHMCAWDA